MKKSKLLNSTKNSDAGEDVSDHLDFSPNAAHLTCPSASLMSIFPTWDGSTRLDREADRLGITRQSCL